MLAEQRKEMHHAVMIDEVNYDLEIIASPLV